MKTSLFSFTPRSRRMLVLALACTAPVAAFGLSGCGGGGGGGGISIPQQLVNVSFQLIDENGNVSDGVVQLSQSGQVVAVQSSSTVDPLVQFSDIPAGTYEVVFTINGVTTPATVVVGADDAQTFQLTSGQNTAPNQGITVSGILRLNPVTGTTAACTDTSAPITARVLVRVRDANQPDRPIIATVIKPAQTSSNVPVNQRGRFQITNVPNLRVGPDSYDIEVVPAPATSADPAPGEFTGLSPVFTLSDNQDSIGGLPICVNAGTFSPVP